MENLSTTDDNFPEENFTRLNERTNVTLLEGDYNFLRVIFKCS